MKTTAITNGGNKVTVEPYYCGQVQCVKLYFGGILVASSSTSTCINACRTIDEALKRADERIAELGLQIESEKMEG